MPDHPLVVVQFMQRFGDKLDLAEKQVVEDSLKLTFQQAQEACTS